MAKWYYNRRGKPVGPHTAAEIVRLIHEGRLGSDDLLYKQGAEQWKPLSEFPEFSRTANFKENKTPKIKDTDRVWIVLVSKKGGGSFQQDGPFSAIELRDKLRSEEIGLSHYVWREGLEKWFRIQSIYQDIFFGNEAEVPEPEKPIIESDTDALIKNVMVHTRSNSQATPEMPDYEESLSPVDVSGPNLVESGIDPRDSNLMALIKRKPQKKKRRRRKPNRKKKSAFSVSKELRSQLLLLAVFVGLLTMGISWWKKK